jgi:O-methyltransferase
MHTPHAVTRVLFPPAPSRLGEMYRSLTRLLATNYMIPSSKRIMCSPLQRSNLFLLAEQVLAFQIQGDIVEIGCHTGESSRSIAMAWQGSSAERTFHVYDEFLATRGDVHQRERFEASFHRMQCPLPKIHEQVAHELTGTDLPEQIAFAHIDLGFAEEPRIMAQRVRHCLELIHPRLSLGGICVLMDYHDPARTVHGWDCSPGVKIACDRFFLHRPERMQVLQGGEYSHGFYRKLATS